MLSAADFPEVFPWMAERLPGHEPTAGCLARWEDDGGRIGDRSSGSRPLAGESEVSSDWVPWFVPFVAFPPALAVATMAILSTSWTGPLR